MGFFDEIADTFKVMKDIVDGGIESYKAGEKLDELIERTLDDYSDVLTTDEKNLHKQFKRSAQAYENNSDSDKNDALLEKMEDDRLAFLESVSKNSSLPKSFRAEITKAIEDFKQANNLALESAAATIEKYAENDEQRAEVRKTFEDSKRK